MKKEVKDFTRWVVFIVCIGMWVLLDFRFLVELY